MVKKKTVSQQKETKDFFEKFSSQWFKSAQDQKNDYVNVIQIRNMYVKSILKKYTGKNPRTLDVACGTGDLVIDLLKDGYDSYGFDFVDSMIKKAKTIAKKNCLPEDHLFVKSFFDFKPKQKFDLISANGFVPYISGKQLNDFIKISSNWVKKNGVFVVESRNRLFNYLSFNDYTKKELHLKELSHLLDENILFNNCTSLNQLLRSNFKPKLKRNLESHPTIMQKHGPILVQKMYQYTPFQIINILKSNKFKIIDIHPNHIHGITTGAKQLEPRLHKLISQELLNNEKLHLRLIPFSSTFSITAKKL